MVSNEPVTVTPRPTASSTRTGPRCDATTARSCVSRAGSAPSSTAADKSGRHRSPPARAPARQPARLRPTDESPSMMSFTARRPAPSRSSLPGRRSRRPPGPAASKERAVGFGNLGSSKEPIKIDADKLDVFDKESRAVFAGNVVAVQGDSTMNARLMTVFYEQKRDQHGAKPAAAPAGRRAPTTARSRRSIARARSPSCRRPRSRPATTPPSTGSPTRSSSSATRPERRAERHRAASGSSTTSIPASPMSKRRPAAACRALFVPGSNARRRRRRGRAAGAAQSRSRRQRRRPTERARRGLRPRDCPLFSDRCAL